MSLKTCIAAECWCSQEPDHPCMTKSIHIHMNPCTLCLDQGLCTQILEQVISCHICRDICQMSLPDQHGNADCYRKHMLQLVLWLLGMTLFPLTNMMCNLWIQQRYCMIQVGNSSTKLILHLEQRFHVDTLSIQMHLEFKICNTSHWRSQTQENLPDSSISTYLKTLWIQTYTVQWQAQERYKIYNKQCEL